MGRLVIAGGVSLVFLVLLVTFWHRVLFLGKLPGDIDIQRGD